MLIRPLRSIGLVGVLGLLAAACAGCADKSYSKYVPSEDKARQALEAALSAWRDGKKPGAIEGAPVAVQAVDSRWQRGEKIAGFEILNEEANEGPRLFSVRLTLQRPAGKQVTVRYYIVGKEPLWIYREDDYKAPAGM
jgi:hypothetical protein